MPDTQQQLGRGVGAPSQIAPGLLHAPSGPMDPNAGVIPQEPGVPGGLPPHLAATQQLQGNDPSMGQNQLSTQGLGPNSGGQDPRYVNYAGQGGFGADGAGGNGNIYQGWPFTPNDPTNPYPAPGGPMGVPWNSAPVAQGLAQGVNQFIPGFTNTIPQGFAGYDQDSRANQFNLMSGMFAGDPMELPGEQAGPMLGAAANMTLGNAINREGRNDMAQQGLLDSIFRTGNNPGVAGSAGMSSMLAENPYTTSGEGLQAEIEGIINRGMANAREGAMQTAQGSLGSAGNRGGESALLQGGLDFGTRAAQADAIGESRVNQAMRRAQDIQNAQNQFAGTSNIFNQSIMQPAALGADFLSNRTNVDTNSLIEQMRSMAGLGMAEAYRKRYDVSTLESMMPAITSLIGSFLSSGGGGGG